MGWTLDVGLSNRARAVVPSAEKCTATKHYKSRMHSCRAQAANRFARNSIVTLSLYTSQTTLIRVYTRPNHPHPSDGKNESRTTNNKKLYHTKPHFLEPSPYLAPRKRSTQRNREKYGEVHDPPPTHLHMSKPLCAQTHTRTNIRSAAVEMRAYKSSG